MKLLLETEEVSLQSCPHQEGMDKELEEFPPVINSHWLLRSGLPPSLTRAEMPPSLPAVWVQAWEVRSRCWLLKMKAQLELVCMKMVDLRGKRAAPMGGSWLHPVRGRMKPLLSVAKEALHFSGWKVCETSTPFCGSYAWSLDKVLMCHAPQGLFFSFVLLNSEKGKKWHGWRGEKHSPVHKHILVSCYWFLNKIQRHHGVSVDLWRILDSMSGAPII